MRNVVGNFDVECSRERLREIWWGTVMWNVVDNFDVGMWFGTVVWNVPENGDVECGGER